MKHIMFFAQMFFKVILFFLGYMIFTMSVFLILVLLDFYYFGQTQDIAHLVFFMIVCVISSLLAAVYGEYEQNQKNNLIKIFNAVESENGFNAR